MIGSGLAGLAAAIRFLRQGWDDLLVLDRGHGVGGTWRDNTYPGAACDVPSHLYSYSFALNPGWSRSFSPQPEIQAYIEKVARRHRVHDRHVFDCEVLSARWQGRGRGLARRDVPGGRSRRPSWWVPSERCASGAAGHPRHRDLRRGHPSLGPLEPRHRSDREAGRRRRHRSVRHPDRAGHRAAGRGTPGCTSAPRPGSCRAWTARTRGPNASPAGSCPSTSEPCAPGSTGPTRRRRSPWPRCPGC
ncbi:NAD(P)-binding protein [Streptomyces tricolor]|nr:NAD(P)-binding protein [Streptomyces tricolor]